LTESVCKNTGIKKNSAHGGMINVKIPSFEGNRRFDEVNDKKKLSQDSLLRGNGKTYIL